MGSAATGGVVALIPRCHQRGDSIETELLMWVVRKHTDCPWGLLYINRWLKAPMQMADGSLIGRERGTPPSDL